MIKTHFPAWCNLCALSGCIFMAARVIAAERANYEIYQPAISTRTFVDPATGKEVSGHDSTITWFKDRWIWQWDDGSEKQGQRIRQTISPDLETWTSPIEVYSTAAGSVNPVVEAEKSSQWQPGFILVGDELWSFWAHWRPDDGLYLSRLRTPDGKWENTHIMPAGGRIFVGNGGMIASTGRILVPVTHQMEEAVGMEDTQDKVIYSDDGGETWAISKQGVHAPSDAWAWEATIWEPTPGRLLMLSRNTQMDKKKGTPIAKTISYASSDDLGVTWQPLERTFLPMELAVSRSHVMRYGSRHILAQNDFWTNSWRHNDQRRNLSLFFTRGTGVDFTAGTLLLGDLTDINCDYPQIAIKGDQAVVCWTWNRKLMSDRPQMLTSVTPLPDPARWYVFPRSGLGRSAATAVRVEDRSCLRFLDDFSSAGVDLDANLPRSNSVRIAFDALIETGTTQALLTIGQPVARIVAEAGQIVIHSGKEKVTAGAIAGWTHLIVTSAPDTLTIKVGEAAAVSLPHRLGNEGRWVYLGQGYYTDLKAKPGASFLINIDSLTTQVGE